MWASLARDAQTRIATGDADGRTRDQRMADLLLARSTGQSDPAAGPPVAVHLVVSDETLFARGRGSAHVSGYGPIPAGLARQLVADGLDADTDATLRRLYACPATGALTAVDSRARRFPAGLARWIELRDRSCRTPWGDAPIRHHDHLRPHAEGGPTSAVNGSGLCEACNYAKQADGWATHPRGGPGKLHVIDFTTPTGHHYRSTAPPLPTPMRHSAVETLLAAHLRAA